VGAGLQCIGTGNPGYFLTLEKTWSTQAWALSGYAGAGYRTNESHGHGLGGLKVTPAGSRWTLGFQADGHDSHPFVTHQFKEMTLGVYLVNMKSLGVLVSRAW